MGDLSAHVGDHTYSTQSENEAILSSDNEVQTSIQTERKACTCRCQARPSMMDAATQYTKLQVDCSTQTDLTGDYFSRVGHFFK